MKNLKTILLLLFLFSLKEIKAQLPNNDATFTLVAIDDFNGGAINTASWTAWGPAVPWTCSDAETIFDPANISVNLGWAKLKVEDLRASPITSCSVTRNFRGGAMISSFKFKYGYYEASAKCPIGKGLTFAFWTLGDCTTNYHEVDILEDNGRQSESGSIMGMAYHWAVSTCTNAYVTGPPEATVSNVSNEHRYGLFWEPGKITWFYDDAPMAEYNTTTTAIDPAYIMFDIGVESGSIFGQGNITATFPAYFELNYLKVWQLQKDCSTPVTFCSDFSAGTWNSNSKVKQSIAIGGSGCSDTINTSSNVNFWATDFVLLDEGTTINDDSSGSFMAKVTECPN